MLVVRITLAIAMVTVESNLKPLPDFQIREYESDSLYERVGFVLSNLGVLGDSFRFSVQIICKLFAVAANAL